jgi:hypothetical protein
MIYKIFTPTIHYSSINNIEIDEDNNTELEIFNKRKNIIYYLLVVICYIFGYTLLLLLFYYYLLYI